MCIPSDAEIARATRDQILFRNLGPIFYTDGSVVNTKVRAVTIQYNNLATRQVFLGRVSNANVFLVEL